MLSIKYRPFIEHPVKRVVTVFAGTISILTVLMVFNHVSTYAGMPPLEFFIWPLLLVLLCLVCCTITITNDKQISLAWTIAGIPVKQSQGNEITLHDDGKSVQLMLGAGDSATSTGILFLKNSTTLSVLKNLPR